ncbi:hypothetical protein PHYBOEH_003773 [Phytophthora boehmeriae]|uniref:Uncharacterized protein n=1 Tax=Phytophthora boehmeriae TaxID=109152 RepID=A0A8T1WS41_9STRA|nr:hypothetical protein PHYBOEH_003773 [Phytophthora boehmeriae]
MSEVETLYARILSLVAPRELHSSCNGVLQYEISQLESSVKDLLAAYAKVEEVRDAVSKLEEGKAPSGRSASLMETMDSSLELQEELSKKLEKVATGMIMAPDPKKHRKRKRDDKSVSELSKEDKKVDKKSKAVKRSEKQDALSSESSSSDDSEDGTKEVKKSKTNDADKSVKPDGTELKLAHKCLKQISMVKVENKAVARESRDLWTSAVLCLKLLIQRQSGWSASSTDKPTADVAAKTLEAAVAVLRMIHLTTQHGEEVRALIAVLSEACSKNEVLRAKFHRGRAQLESLAMSIPDPTNSKPPRSKQSTVNKRTEGMKERLTWPLDQVRQWQDGIFALDQLDKVIKEVNEVMSCNAKDWNPYADPRVHECVGKLEACVNLIKKDTHRQKRLKTVRKLVNQLEKQR